MQGLVPQMVLDDRTFEDLVKEARARAMRFLPELTAEWSDFNPSDPGSTLIDLFAWFTEQMLYRLNRVPELHQRKFMELLGLSLRTARPAEVLLEFRPSVANRVVEVPAGIHAAGASADGKGQVFFETLESVELIPRPLVAVRVFDGVRFLDHSRDHAEMGGHFEPFGDGSRGNALYMGFKPLNAAAAAKGDGSTAIKLPKRLKFYVQVHRETEVMEQGRFVRPKELPGEMAQSEVILQWSYRAEDRWVDLDTIEDHTNSFVRNGRIDIESPSVDGAQPIRAVPEAECSESLYWVRCSVKQGRYSLHRPPRIACVQHNTVRAEQRMTVRDEALGVGSGEPGQVVTLRNTPILQDSLRVVTTHPDEGRKVWREVEGFGRETADAFVYVLDPVSGRVFFGGRGHGAPPPKDHAIRAEEYRFGGGAQGNVLAGEVRQLLSSHAGVASVSNSYAAFGGEDAESVPELVTRAPSELRRRSRAVTEDDFERLVMDEVGGVAVARALPLVHPSYPGVDVPGCVTVVVVPDWNFSPETSKRVEIEPPRPSATLQSVVKKLLDERRLIGTELHISGPRFATVRVHGVVRVADEFALSEVEKTVIRSVRDFVLPVPSSLWGVDVTRWEMGASLHPSLLLARILGVEGVVGVSGFHVDLDGRRLERDAVEETEATTLLWPDGEHELAFERDRGRG